MKYKQTNHLGTTHFLLHSTYGLQNEVLGKPTISNKNYFEVISYYLIFRFKFEINVTIKCKFTGVNFVFF